MAKVIALQSFRSHSTKLKKQSLSTKTIKQNPNSFNIDESLIEGVTYKIATTQHELEQAFQLVHKVLNEEGFISPHPSRILINAYNSHPDTVVFVGIKNKKVISTLTLVCDSDFGLPMDEWFPEELSSLRDNTSNIGQVCAFASEVTHKLVNHTESLFLLKIVYLYARNHLRLDNLIMMAASDSIYENALQFKMIGKVSPTSYMKDKAEFAYSLKLENLSKRYSDIFHSQKEESNLYHFFFLKYHSNIQLPHDNSVLYIWNNDKLDYFFNQKTDVFSELEREHLSSILKNHSIYQESSCRSWKHYKKLI